MQSRLTATRLAVTLPLVFVLAVGIFALRTDSVAANPPQGFVRGLSDYSVDGCATEGVQIHVYSEPGIGMIGLANSNSTDIACPAGQKRFWVQYRRPVNDISGVAVALVQSGEAPVWLDTHTGVDRRMYLHRGSDTFLYENTAYKIGISRRFGGAILEYYNKRVDPTLNLVSSDIGAAFQVGAFGTRTFPAFGDWTDNQTPENRSCVDKYEAGNRRWNPTQAGNHCPSPDGEMTSSTHETCISGGAFDGCSNNTYTCTDPNGCYGTLKFNRVRMRGFVYPWGQHEYQWYDDAYLDVEYRFERNHVLVDYYVYRDWNSWPYNWGNPANDPAPWTSAQQLPVAFLNQITWFQYGYPYQNQTYRSCGGNCTSTKSMNDPNTARWVTAVSSDAYSGSGQPPVMSPGNHLTLGFYSRYVNGTCPARSVQMDFQTDLYQHAAIVQNALKFTMPGQHELLEGIAVIFPYMFNDTPAGASLTVGQLIDNYGAQGGLRPDWECNN